MRSLVKVSRMDRIRNDKVRMSAGIERESASRADQRVLRWFWHVERLIEYHMARRVLMAEKMESGYGQTEVRLDGWRVGGLGRQKDDCVGCATMSKR